MLLNVLIKLCLFLSIIDRNSVNAGSTIKISLFKNSLIFRCNKKKKNIKKYMLNGFDFYLQYLLDRKFFLCFNIMWLKFFSTV